MMMAYSPCRYGVSRERVRQLETAAMRKLQIASREHGLDCYRQSLL
jgi:DNA-directed RNA polymerase sigma subunit (sigma70/sigma32)